MRELRIVEECIANFALDLTDFVVFTEAATGPFAWTAAIALRAGASGVLALAKDSRFGTRDEAEAAVRRCARATGGDARLTVVPDHSDVGSADIVTNLGFVRPIDRRVVQRLKASAVVPLMCETWEWRREDLDLQACRERGILVLGTDEHHPELRTFEYVGLLAGKLLYQLGVEVLRSAIVVVGGGIFGEAVTSSLLRNGARVHLVCAADRCPAMLQQRWTGPTLGSASARESLANADAVVFAEHESVRPLLGRGADLSVEQLLEANCDLRIAHVSGVVDAPELLRRGFRVAPKDVATAPHTMSVTTASLGARPVIELHAAGLKVGEQMARARRRHGDLEAAKREALQHPLCQDFPVGVGDGRP